VIAREELHELIDQIPESELPAARSYLRYLAQTASDPVLRSLLNAPIDDEPETEEERKAVDEAKEALAEGRVMSDEEMARVLGL
jgi:Spy/CpxP family protein refolding chaperone